MIRNFVRKVENQTSPTKPPQPAKRLPHALDITIDPHFVRFGKLTPGRVTGKVLLADVVADAEIAALLQTRELPSNQVVCKDLDGTEFVMQIQMTDPNGQKTAMSKLRQGGTVAIEDPMVCKLGDGSLGVLLGDKEISLNKLEWFHGSTKSMIKLNEEMRGPPVKTCMRRECIVTEPGLMDCPGCPRAKWCSQECYEAQWEMSHEVQCAAFRALEKWNRAFY